MESEIASIQPNPYLFNIENSKRRKAKLAHEIGAGARCLKCDDKCPGFELHFWRPIRRQNDKLNSGMEKVKWPRPNNRHVEEMHPKDYQVPLLSDQELKETLKNRVLVERKVCQNCRCGKDDHDVQEEDEDIGKIVIGKLFERPIRTKEDEQKYSYGTDLEIVNETTGRKEKMKFDWIPPGVASNIAKRYMEMLPPEKRPVAGTEAAKERKRQLEHQLPLYDMDESERCENLPPDEIQNFQKYLEKLRSSVTGQASVQEIGKLLSVPDSQRISSDQNFARNSSRLTQGQAYFNAGNKFLNQSDPINNEYSYSENALNNNIPSIAAKHVVFDDAPGILHDIPKITDDFEEMMLNNQNNYPVEKNVTRHLETSFPYHPPTSSSLCKPLDGQFASSRSFQGMGPPMSNSAPTSGDLNQFSSANIKNILVDNFHVKQNINKSFPDSGIKNLSGPKPYIAKSTEQNLLPGQYSSYLTGGGKGSFKNNEKSPVPLPYATLSVAGPRELISLSNTVHYQKPYEGDVRLPQNQCCEESGHPRVYPHDGNQNQSFSQLPQMLPVEGQVFSTYATQAPYTSQRDTIIGAGRFAEGKDVKVLFPKESEILSNKPRKLNEMPPSDLTLFSCQYCNESMKSGDVAVICERAGPDKYWHPQCFVCVTCNELLADLIYFYKDGQIFCGRHYTQAADIPRCKACDELIFSETWTRADGFDWHIQHYCCFMCDNPLAGKKYIPDEKCFPHCMSCYMAFKAKMCETCEDKIPPSETRAGFRGYFYHAKPECFCCYSCRQPMIGKKFKMVKNWVFCSQECINMSERDIMDNPNPKEK